MADSGADIFEAAKTLEWRICHATTDYEVSERGDVRRRTPGRKTWPGKLLRPKWHWAGYPRYGLTIAGKKVSFEAHRLVAEAFIGPRPFPGAEVAHNDGDPKNNHFTNLSWKTHQGNVDDMRRHGTNPAGARNAMAKLRPADVLRVRELRREGWTMAKIGAEVGSSIQNVSKILNGQRWSSL